MVTTVGLCCRACGQTAQQEWAAEGTTRAVGARRGARRQWQRRVNDVTRAGNEQRTANTVTVIAIIGTAAIMLLWRGGDDSDYLERLKIPLAPV